AETGPCAKRVSLVNGKNSCGFHSLHINQCCCERKTCVCFQVCGKVDSADYQYSSLVFSVSLPPQLLVREHATWLLVKQEAGQPGSLTKDDVLQLKEVYKWLTHPLLSEELGVPVDGKSLFEVSVIFAHPETDGDCHFLYNKFSRNLPQTPWVIDGERKMESSVEELIAEPLTAMFKSDSFNFSSSGREDVDVRTLGYGRPFAIEVLNPHRWSCTQEEITELQQQINKSTDKIRVRDLQIVTREAVGHMKEGEEEKTKCYSALIWTQRAIERSDINFLQDMMELKLDQKTPLRVLHRRPLAVRFRVIHSMKVDYIDQHHFRLYLKTQAGTYIKEFVHGDFGRTKPNLGILMKTTVDILELDVEVRDVPQAGNLLPDLC
uniref:tRNA pseudouridine(55) synthase n=1 Tax=Callorhinchus milii TaxID=7868 RepID=A0A4W3GMD1_CALMI